MDEGIVSPSSSDIDERTRAREEALSAAIEETRRMALPSDYVFDKSQEQFWDLRDGTIHTEKAVNASIPIEHWRVHVVEGNEGAADGERGRGRPRQRRERLIPPSADILRVESDQFVEGSTWWPGQPLIIKDVFIDNNGWRPAKGRRIYNKYLPPPPINGDPTEAGPWVEHVKALWPDPDEHEFFFDYCAHLIQKPEEKCNAAIVLSGVQGIGKDAAIYPVRSAVGIWNSKNVSPDDLFSQYRPWLETLMLIVDEVRPSKDEFHASSAYNILKPFIVTPPDTLPVNDKYTKLRHIINRLRMFITTNDWMSMYIPPEDRRMFVMHSEALKGWHEKAKGEEYFSELFTWFDSMGAAHVAAWLSVRDLKHFKPKAQVKKTRGWEAVAASWSEPEDCVSQALDRLGRPKVIFGQELSADQFDGAEELAGMLKSPRKIAHRMTRAGYMQVQPPDGVRWCFSVNGKSLRARYAFVLNGAAKNANEAAAMVRKHGLSLIK